MSAGGQGADAPEDGAPSVDEPAATASAEPSAGAPPSWRAEIGDAPTVLWIIGILAALAAALSRGIEPALPGVWIGADHVITIVKLVAAMSSQLFAVSAAAVMIGLVLATVRSALPSYLRAFSVVAGVLVILAVLIASIVRLPNGSRLVLAFTSAVLTGLAAWSAARFYNLRGAALILGAMVAAAVLRILSILVVSVATVLESEAFGLIARGVSTASLVLETVGVVLAVVWLVIPASREPLIARPRPERPASNRDEPRWIVATLVTIASGAVLYLVHLGLDPEASGGILLLARSVKRLLLRPEPFVPELARAVVEVMAWVVLVATLIVTPRGRLMSAVVALALIARGALDLPLCAMALAISGLALAHHPGPDLHNEFAALRDRSAARESASR